MSLDLSLYFDLDTGGEAYTVEVFELNITHNLGEMADKAGLYSPMWGDSCEIAMEVVSAMEAGIEYMENNETDLKDLNPKNGWGAYEVLLKSANEYLKACRAYPKAKIHRWK